MYGPLPLKGDPLNGDKGKTPTPTKVGQVQRPRESASVQTTPTRVGNRDCDSKQDALALPKGDPSIMAEQTMMAFF